MNAPKDAVQLQLAAQGPDGAPLTYSATGLPVGLTVSPSSGLITGAIDANAAGASPYTVTVAASDGRGASGSQTFHWAVDSVYVADPGDQNYYGGQSVTLPIVARDNLGDALTYAATGLPAGLAVQGAKIVGTVAASAVSANPYNVVLTVVNTLGQTATAAFTVTVDNYTVLFSPNPVTAGYLISADGEPARLPKPVIVTGTISDVTKLENISLVAGEMAQRISLGQIKLTRVNGVLQPQFTVEVDGVRATPASQPSGDTTISAEDSTDKTVKGTVRVKVVIPAAIRKDNHPEVTATKFTAENIVLTSTKSPGLRSLDPKNALLVTAYVIPLKIPVVDQFGYPLSDIYVGAGVSESDDNGRTWYPINQAIVAGGTYTDPVFPYEAKEAIADATTVQAKADIAAWLKAPTLKIPAGTLTERISVQVGGHSLQSLGSPDPAIKGRKVTWTADGTVTIEWPDY